MLLAPVCGATCSICKCSVCRSECKLLCFMLFYFIFLLRLSLAEAGLAALPLGAKLHPQALQPHREGCVGPSWSLGN